MKSIWFKEISEDKVDTINNIVENYGLKPNKHTNIGSEKYKIIKWSNEDLLAYIKGKEKTLQISIMTLENLEKTKYSKMIKELYTKLGSNEIYDGTNTPIKKNIFKLNDKNNRDE